MSLCGTTSSKNREGGGTSDNAKSMPMPINDISTESTEVNTSDERSFDLPNSNTAIGEQQAGGGGGGEGTDTSFGFGSWLASQQFDASAIISPNNNLSSIQQEEVNNNKWDNNSQYSREIKETDEEQQSQDGYVSIADVTNSGNSHTRNNIVNVILDKVNCSNGNSAWQCWNNDTTATSSTSKVKKSKIVTPTKKKKTHRRCASPSILKKDSSFVVDQHGVSLGRAKSEGHTTSQTEQTLKKSLSWAEDKKNIVAHGVEMGVTIEKELVGSSKSGHIAGEDRSIATASITAGSMTDQELSPKDQPVCWPSALDTPSRSDIKKNTPQSPDLSEASSYTGRVVQNITKKEQQQPQTIALTTTDISASLAGEDLVSEAQSFPEGCASTAQTSLAYSASPAKHPFGGKIEARPFSSPAVAATASPRTSNPLAQTGLFDNNPQFTSGLIDVQQPHLEEDDENDAQPLLTTVTSSDSNDQVPVVRRSLANKGRSRRRMRLAKK